MDYEDKNMRVSLSPNPQGLIKFLIFFVLMALFAFLAVSTKNAWERGGKDTVNKNVITVSAGAKRVVKPDTAEASFTIRKENASLVAARDEVSTLSGKVIDYLKSRGVEEKDIKTTSYNIYPQEEYDSRPCILESGASIPCPPRKRTKTFVVEETFDVKIKNLDNAGEIITGVSTAGANQVSALRFTVNDDTRKELSRQAREEAITKARDDAKRLAKSLDVRLGELISFNEAGTPPPIYYDKRVFAVETALEAAPAPSIQAGENEIVSSVSLTYEIQ